MEHNKIISGEVRITSRTKFYNLLIIFFIIERDALIMYHKFDYKIQQSTLITCTRWLP